MTGLRWSATWGRGERVGVCCLGFWGGRGQTRTCRGIFIRRLPRQCYSLGLRRGSSLRGWRRPWIDFSPGSRGGSLGGIRGKRKTGDGITRLWRRQWGKRGIEGVRKSITRRQNTVSQYIATQPILDLCKRATQRPGAQVPRRWWEQAGIDLEGGEETGGGVNNEIGDRVGGGVGQETERIRGRRGGVSGSERVKWSGLERGG